jgi:hypothetical protein
VETFVQLTITGLANGAILALAALGFVIIFKATGVINFAQGFFLLVGAYVVWSMVVQVGLHWSLAVVVALAVAVADRADDRALRAAPAGRRERDLGDHGHDRPRVDPAGRGAVPVGHGAAADAAVHPPRLRRRARCPDLAEPDLGGAPRRVALLAA